MPSLVNTPPSLVNDMPSLVNTPPSLRNMECPGEDPYVSSVFAEMYIKGFQGFGHPSGIKKAINTPKHFTGQLFEVNDTPSPCK